MMKKIAEVGGWISVVFTIITVILTLLTTYQYTYVKYFNSYYAVQTGLFFTMIFWSIRFWLSENLSSRVTYSLICLFIAMGSMFFRFMEIF